ncbi:YhcN/YlaJ family sporulation lipoprotein [Paenibacillus sp. L3-i20]|uniref:YhcN/YlaJ family sporulation lipoprotein n=1 Tax=Paenibacillus sp. L3-i20 TaxID=2905833 RepID=UPI001EDC9782|nr:YhcN/YlaJ family sporulation lipoprotein [Paenibacillus sp. L3-i20]GKU80262.1 hypothetical protein L3i20_v246590 [Paenibacillus sp. L3-i20]
MQLHVKRAVSALLLGGILVVSGGCGMGGANNEGQGTVKPNTFVSPTRLPYTAHKTVPEDKNKLHMRSQSNMGEGRINRDQLVRIVEQVPGVENADIAMSYSEVLVGIGIDNIGKRKIIEKQVYSALQWQYPEYNYYVTSDVELHEKIKAVNVRAAKGYNVQMYEQDISALARAIAHSLTRN